MLSKRLDYPITLIPFLCVVLLCVLFMAAPEASSHTLESIRFFLGDTFGSYYLIIGLGIFFCSLYMAFSRYGSIRLGNLDKPQYSNFKWGSMMFTAGLAADILFYSLCEWMLYASEPHIADMGGIQDWASVYPLFHWGPIPWSFYMTLAVAFGFMLHVRRRNKQKYSEACRPLLGKYTDRLPGKFIDLLALFALLAGTATTFALATPLLSLSISHVLHIPQSNFLSVAILVITCVTYTAAVYFGMNGIIRLAASCIYLFFALLLYVFVCGGEMVYTVETGLSALGNLTQNFLSMATWTDALRTSSFPQNWTIFYWAYWMVWCVAAPFFIGSISKGRTIRQTVLGGYLWGLGRHLHLLHRPGKLRPGASDDGKAGRAGHLRGHGGPLPVHPGHHGDPALPGPGADPPGPDHDHLLRHLLRRHRRGGLRLLLQKSGVGRGAGPAAEAVLVPVHHAAADCPDLL